MNFSKETCIICNSSLLIDVNSENSEYYFMPEEKHYSCPVQTIDRHFTNTRNITVSHYIFRQWSPEGSYSVELIYYPYKLNYHSHNDSMSISLIQSYNSNLYMFKSVPLKVDYSNSEEVIRKIKGLVLFS